MTRCRFLWVVALAACLPSLTGAPEDIGFRLTDITARAGVRFVHHNGAFGRKYLPEILGAGGGFLDYDGDGLQDLLLVDGAEWPGRPKRAEAGARLFRNAGGGKFVDATRGSGLDLPIYGMGMAAADFDNDGRPDVLITAVGQSRLFRNTGGGRFTDVTMAAGLGGHEGFGTLALWFDYDRDGWLDLLIGNYVRWSLDTDVFCSVDGKNKSYCTPEAYSGATLWLFRNRGNGTFEDVTVAAGLFDMTSKSLGAAMLDYDLDGWPDLFIANDTQPNKLYRNTGKGKFEEAALKAGVAFNQDGRARAGMGTDAADFDNSGLPSIVVSNFQNEMLGLYAPLSRGLYTDMAPLSEVGRASRLTLGFGCFFFDADLDGTLDLLVVNGHIDDTRVRPAGASTFAEPPHLFQNRGARRLLDVAAETGRDFALPKVGRGAAFADIDLDGDLDVMVTTNGGPVYLYRNDIANSFGSFRVALRGTKSNRDGIGAVIRVVSGGTTMTRTVHTGSSYLSQSELPVTFGLARRASAESAVVEWPSGIRDKIGPLVAGRSYEVTEGKGISAVRQFQR